MSDKHSTETEREWARRVGLAGQSDQAGESVKDVARVIGTYYHALLAERVPKRMAQELTFHYQQALFEMSMASMGSDTEQP